MSTVGLPPSAPRSLVYYRRPRDYPRSRRISRYLEERGVEVRVVEAHDLSPSTLVQVLAELWSLWRLSRGADAVLVAEMQLQYAAAAAVVARLRRRPLVVDAFIGLEETVRDRARGPVPAPRLAAARALDRLALASASAVLVDTAVRGRALVRRTGLAPARVAVLPVGAPGWAGQVVPHGEAGPALRVLYYGNYIPLHGVEALVEGLARTRRPVEAVLVGDGQDRAAAEALVDALGCRDRITFLPPVPEADLVPLLSWCDVVLGIFGTSEKAATVVANKVWQGLAAGRTVVTRESPALQDLEALVGDALVTVPAGDGAAIAAALAGVRAAPHPGLDVVLESHVRRAFDRAFRQVCAALVRPGARP
ncbi:glycosyltransferase [Cellulomonas endophytica]|uniref:glycosyltransferase n=1 Tax=Cellulomonas endophytica TaxID=2494735 RepID=UPI001011877E|nr:glycosyltransferase [Cellulomonas endophytica]